jgi:hypothetical protein
VRLLPHAQPHARLVRARQQLAVKGLGVARGLGSVEGEALALGHADTDADAGALGAALGLGSVEGDALTPGDADADAEVLGVARRLGSA